MRYDHIEHVKKANPYHDSLGRFTTASGGGAASGGSGAAIKAVDELNSLPRHKGMRKVPYEDIKTYEKVLNKMPVGTKITHDTEAGTEEFEKVKDTDIGIGWKHTRQPWGKVDNVSAFDVGRWMAATGNITRGPFELKKNIDIIEE